MSASPRLKRPAAQPLAGLSDGPALQVDRGTAPVTPDPEVPTPARVLRRFRQVFNVVKTHFQQVEKQAGIGGAQLWALSLIRDQPGMGVGALAKAMDIHQTTASNLVKALTTLDLVEAQRQGSDRRAVQLLVRPEGLKVLRRAPGPLSGVLPEALAHLDPAVLARLDQDLAVLITALQIDEQAARIPLAQLSGEA
jgi:DNA-binding MarR family transcriptional regulator